MSIEEQVMTRMKEAMRNKNQQELGALRMVKSEAQAAKTAPGFDGKTDDAFWLDVIEKYVKQQARSRVEFEKAGEAGREQMEQLTYEIEYFSEFLPKKLGVDEVRAIVKQAIAETGASGAKMAGKVIGAVMKSHKGEVDAQMVKELAVEELG